MWMATGIAILLVFGWVALVRARTPSRLTLLTGPEGSTSYVDGQRYKSLLEARGLRVEVEATEGSLGNMERLAQGGAHEAAFAEVGLERILDPSAAENLESLGSLYVQPIRLFVRKELEDDVPTVREVEGRRVVLGADRSATRALAELLLEINGIEERA